MSVSIYIATDNILELFAGHWRKECIRCVIVSRNRAI